MSDYQQQAQEEMWEAITANDPGTSWKTEVCVEGSWASNALRFATEQEALDAGAELLSRWFVPTGYRAAISADPVNARQPDAYSRAEMIREGSHV